MKSTAAKKRKPKAQPAPKPSAEPKAPLVRLELDGVDAISVCVAGSFNEWCTSSLPMTQVGPGRWVAEFSLAPGAYEYLFIVDGQWWTDPRCLERVANPYGGENCVLKVE